MSVVKFLKLLTVVAVFLSFSCNYDHSVRQALRLSRKNKPELEKALQYFKKQGHIEKQKAMEFLIANLPYNYSFDTTNLHKYRFIPNTAKRLYKEKKADCVHTTLDRIWYKDEVLANSAGINVYNKPVIRDIEVITSKYLIENVERAYQSWKSNPYTKNTVSFHEFCEYILPYRLLQGYAIEDWRPLLQAPNRVRVSKLYPLAFEKARDSLFSQYNDYVFDYHITEGLPILKVTDFMNIRRGKCNLKTWLNTYIGNSEGIPTVVDFVPAWGHSEGGHEWTSIVYNGKTTYFPEPYDVSSRFFLGASMTYDNKLDDDFSGRIRLPKVYRHTYSSHFLGPLSDSSIDAADIPTLFRNIKMMDVSNQYFETTDLTVVAPKPMPKNPKYVYLCVLGKHKQWVPVQWGQVEKNKVVFKNMGRGILYQAALYKNNGLTPFGNAIFLSSKGKAVEYTPRKEVHRIVVKRKYPPQRALVKEAKRYRGAKIEASNSADFKNTTTLVGVDFDLELRPYDFEVKTKRKYRYFRIVSSSTMGIRKGSYITDKNRLELYLTGNKNEKNFSTNVDMGKPVPVSNFSIIPRNHLNYIMKDLDYELFYLDRGQFISLGQKKATSYELSFENVPKKAMLYLQCLNNGWQERIFEYSEGQQVWY